MTRTSHDNHRASVALYPGTFDPFTAGHMSILRRALALFDRVVIAVGVNDAKPCRHTLDERLRQIRDAVSEMERVDVVSYRGLTVEAAREADAGFILRGVRTPADFEYERQLAQVNLEISGLETVLLYALPEMSHVSSSMVRELEKNGFDVSRYLPKPNNKGK